MDAYFRLASVHRAFVEAFIANKENGAEAMRKIGYDGTRPRQAAWRFRKRADVQAAIAELQAERRKQFGATLERAVEGAANRANADPLSIFDEKGGFLPINKWPAEIRDSIESIEFDGDKPSKVRFASRNEANKQLLQVLGVTEKHEVTGKSGAPLAAPAATVYIIGKEEQKAISSDLESRV